MYDANHYGYDINRQSPTAHIKNGAILYRLASIHFCDKAQILNGLGPVGARKKGRFNEPDQLTTYCANNVLVCLSEVLYHLYRSLLDAIRDKADYDDVCKCTVWKKCLVVFKVKEIQDIIYIDSDGVRVQYDSRITGTTVVFPDPVYDPFYYINSRIRNDGKEGLFYTSARHSRDICIALFNDKTEKAIDVCEKLPVELQLIPEGQDPKSIPIKLNPYKDRAHPTMGYYKFENSAEFNRVCHTGVINPKHIPSSGIMDFVRRNYAKYPKDAILR